MTEQPNSPLGSGWNDLNVATHQPTQAEVDKQQEELSASKARLKQACLDAYALFSSEAGKRLLEYLHEEFMHQSCLPSAIHQGLDGNSVAILMGERDGENNMVRRLESMAKMGAKTNEPA